MAMSPRILLCSAIGITLYLGLSLYHGHQLKKYPVPAGSGKAQEKNWVQVSTSEKTAAGPVQPRTDQEGPKGAAEETVSGNNGGRLRPIPVLEQDRFSEPPAVPDDPQVLLAALQAELRQARTLLKARDEELRQARLRLDQAQAEQQQAEENGDKWLEEKTPVQSEQERQLAEIGRLQTELKQARTRAAIAEGELERAQLKAEAMYRYGQEQSRLLAPARQEAEILKDRLAETKNQLHEVEQQVTALRHQEEQLRRELDGLRRAPREAKAPASPAGNKTGPTPAAEKAD
jgi:hypothetical protein